MQGRCRWSSTIFRPDASGRRRARMTYRSERVPFGSVAAYRPGRPRLGDTAMTRQGWELVMDLKFSDPERIKNIASWLASDHGQDLFPTCFGSGVVLVPAPGHAPRAKGGEPRSTTVELVRSMESEGLGRREDEGSGFTGWKRCRSPRGPVVPGPRRSVITPRLPSPHRPFLDSIPSTGSQSWMTWSLPARRSTRALAESQKRFHRRRSPPSRSSARSPA